jgi:hypothetical protein
MPRISRAFSISSGDGGITGIMALTNAFVMLDFRDIIVWTEGIRKAEASALNRRSSQASVTWLASPYLQAWALSVASPVPGAQEREKARHHRQR